MTDVIYSTVLDVPANKAWHVVRDFGGLPEWFSFVSQSVLREGTRPTEIGAVRDDTVDRGKIISEKLVESSGRERRKAYALLDGDVPMTDYSSTLAIHEITDGDRTFAVGTARYELVGDPPLRKTGCETEYSKPVFKSWSGCSRTSALGLMRKVQCLLFERVTAAVRSDAAR